MEEIKVNLNEMWCEEIKWIYFDYANVHLNYLLFQKSNTAINSTAIMSLKVITL
jgi:hypothetical protein